MIEKKSETSKKIMGRELVELAKSLKIIGFRRMTKLELSNCIKAKEKGDDSTVDKYQATARERAKKYFSDMKWSEASK